MESFWSLFKHPPPPDPDWGWRFDQTYYNTYIDDETLLEDVPAVVLDTETTGLNIRRARIRSIAAIRINYPLLRTKSSFEVQFQHQTDADKGVAVHQILPKHGEVSDGEALEALFHFIGGRIIVGHHIKFDIKMLEKAMSRHLGKRVKIPHLTLDTANLAEVLFPRHPLQGAWPLDELCQKLGVTTFERHTAGGDAFITGLVYLKLVARLSDGWNYWLGNARYAGPRRHWRL